MPADSRFKEPADGSKELVNYKNDWSLDLSSKSIQASYAIIGAAWAVYGGTNGGFFNNDLALLAVSLAIAHIGFSLIVQLSMIEMLTNRYWSAQRDAVSWKREWEQSGEPHSVWPFTSGIQILGRSYHWLKVIFPVTAAILLIISFWC